MAPSNVPPATAMTIANNFVWRVIRPCAGVAVVHLVVEDEGEKGLTHVEVAAEVNLEIMEEEEEGTMIVEEVVVDTMIDLVEGRGFGDRGGGGGYDQYDCGGGDGFGDCWVGGGYNDRAGGDRGGGGYDRGGNSSGGGSS